MAYTLRRPPGTDTWHAYFLTRDGKRFRRSTKQTDKRKADIVAAEWFRRLGDPTYQAAHEATVESAVRRLKDELADAGKSPGTLHFYKVKLGHVNRVLGADTKLANITAARVDEYIHTRKLEGAKAYTISKELTALRKLLKHARRRGEFDKELSQVMPVGFATGYKPRKRRLTVHEAVALILELPPNVGRYAAFVCATTARDAAVPRALGKHLLDGGIRVYDQKTKASSRVVPLTPLTWPFAWFAFYGIAPSQQVAPGMGSVRHAFDRASTRLGIPHVTPNDLRRSVAHWLLQARVPRDIVAPFMGHATTKMLDLVYGKLDHEELGSAIRRTLDGSWKSGPEAGNTGEPGE